MGVVAGDVAHLREELLAVDGPHLAPLYSQTLVEEALVSTPVEEALPRFRVQMDHLPLWWGPSAAGSGIGQGTVQIIEYMARIQPSKYTKKYGWLDPDFLMTLYPELMDFTKSRTEVSFWALWSAPLLVVVRVMARRGSSSTSVERQPLVSTDARYRRRPGRASQ